MEVDEQNGDRTYEREANMEDLTRVETLGGDESDLPSIGGRGTGATSRHAQFKSEHSASLGMPRWNHVVSASVTRDCGRWWAGQKNHLMGAARLEIGSALRGCLCKFGDRLSLGRHAPPHWTGAASITS